MSDLNKWYLAGMVNAADKSEFKEDEHPRGKGGMFVKKGEGGGGLSALEEVYKKGGFKHPEALAKADFEELGKMSDSRLDAEITMLKGKVEEGGKPLDKARLEAANGIMKGRKSTNDNSLVGLSDEMLEGAVRYGTSMLNDDKVSPKDKEEAKRNIERAKAELAKRVAAKDEFIKNSKKLWDGMSDNQLEKQFEILGGKDRNDIAASAELNGIHYYNDYVDALKEYIEKRKNK